MTITFPATPLTLTVELAIGADLTADPDTWTWTDITQYVRFTPGITVTQGRRDERSVVQTLSAQLTLDNRDGRFARRNPNSPYYGLLSFNTPIKATVDAGNGPSTRLAGFVNSWPVRWSDKSAKDSTVPIQCAGILRRLIQGSVLKSPLYRAIEAAAPAAYWPLESGDAASTFGTSGLAGGSPTRTFSGSATFGTSLAAGSAGAIDLSDGLTFTAPTGQVVAAAPNGWEFECVVGWDTLPAVPPGELYAVAWAQSAGAGGQMGFGLANSGGTIYWADFIADQGSGSYSPLAALPVPEAGRGYHVRVVGHQDGTGLRNTLYVDGVSVFDDGFIGTLMMPESIVVNGTDASPTASAAASPSTFAHLAFWQPFRASPTTHLAADGYRGEQAHDRMTRLSTEEGVRFTTAATATALMGPQSLDAYLNLLRDCEAADGGVLYETNWGLGYQSLRERYNQTVALALDFHSRHIAVEPEPADDDQRLRNKWTVSRTNGGSAVAEDATSIAANGTYDDSATINVASDDQLPDQAAWRLHVSS